jgi:hypothetical protein
MKIFITKLLLIALVLTGSLCFIGCEKKAEQLPSNIVVLPSGEEITKSYEHITPAETKYQGEGVEYSREVKSVRIVSPFGISPGEVISRQVAAEINTGQTPSINIKPEAIGRFFAWLIPFFGGLIEWLGAKLTKKSAKQIVNGGTTFKDKVKADDRLTEDVKKHVLEMFRSAHRESHDEKTNEFVSMLKD